MNNIEKLGLAIMIMSAMYIPEGGVRGGVCVGRVLCRLVFVLAPVGAPNKAST